MNELENGFEHPSLVLPYRKMALRDKAYPYVLTGAIAVAVALVIVYINLQIVK